MHRAHSTLITLMITFTATACAAGPKPKTRATSQPVPAIFKDDPVMVPLTAELQRSEALLALPGYDAPYYMAFGVKELRSITIAGKGGAILLDEQSVRRNAYVDVRVGTYAFDSSEDIELEWVEEGVYEPSSILPLDDDPSVLRHALWLLADLRFKQALSSYLKLKGQRVYKVTDPDKRPSFSQAPSVVHADPIALLTADHPHWAELVRSAGAILGSDPALFDSEVQAVLQLETRWLANTEGVRVRTTHPMAAFHMSAYTRAPDGMMLEHSADLYAPTGAGLPSKDDILAAAQRLRQDLADLRAAPVLEPYTGPAILEAHATGVFFHEVLGHRLEGHRQDGDGEGQTFTKHLNQRILPTFISLVDDPTLRVVDGTPLNGQYDIDDEGVAAQAVTLVDHGVLKSFLQTRKPVKGFSASNGHGRAQGNNRPVARMGNLTVVAHESVSEARLKAMLLEQARAQGKPFGLIIRDISGGSTNTSSYGYQAFKGEARMVYKVDLDTGEETLVRGVELVGTPLTTINKILAAGDMSGVFNGYCGAESGMVPVSTIAPATLFEEIELQRAAQPRSRGPVLPPPPAITP